MTHPVFQCTVHGLQYDFGMQHGYLRMDDGNCCDMDGCIAEFQKIDPDVCLIATWAGDKPDTVYQRTASGWVAR